MEFYFGEKKHWPLSYPSLTSVHTDFNFSKYTKRINHSKFVICSIEGPISTHKQSEKYIDKHIIYVAKSHPRKTISKRRNGKTSEFSSFTSFFRLPFETNFRRIFFTKCARFEFAKPQELFRYIIFYWNVKELFICTVCVNHKIDTKSSVS